MSCLPGDSSLLLPHSILFLPPLCLELLFLFLLLSWMVDLLQLYLGIWPLLRPWKVSRLWSPNYLPRLLVLTWELDPIYFCSWLCGEREFPFLRQRERKRHWIWLLMLHCSLILFFCFLSQYLWKKFKDTVILQSITITDSICKIHNPLSTVIFTF
jgi:hypothetical protein